MKKKIKCLWFKDHDNKKHNYKLLTYAFGVCDICRMEARSTMRMYVAPSPRKIRKLRKARKPKKK